MGHLSALRARWTYLWWRVRGNPKPPTWHLTVPASSSEHVNRVLAGAAEVSDAVDQLGWEHPTRDKTWDFLLAARCLTRHGLAPEDPVLDAGCVGSPILEWLYGRGHRALYGVDLSREGLPAVPGLRFRRADLTRTPFPDGFFQAITCLSVIEHGVDLDAFVTEAARLLAPGGLLLVSCDYHDPKISTDDVPRESTFGLPWTVFDRQDVEALIAGAAARGLHLAEPVHWDMQDTPVTWNGKEYTFLFLAFTKR